MEIPRFNPFDPRKAVHIYHRHLPHWRQEGGTYFVTLRQADSVPRRVLEQWIAEDHLWLAANGLSDSLSEEQWQTTYEKIPDQRRREFERRKMRRLHVALDACEGTCLFRQPMAARTMGESLRFFHGSLWWVGDVVVMPNHLHALVQPRSTVKLENVLQRVKRFVATELGKLGLKPEGVSFWQKESYDHIVRNDQELNAYRRYIEQNPEKARLKKQEYWLHKADWL